MPNFQVTIGYKAIITIDVNTETETQAKEKAIEIMKRQREKMFKRNDFALQDDNFKADGILNMDETWNML